MSKHQLSSCDLTFGVVGLVFDSRVVQIDHSTASGSPPLRRFFGACVIGFFSGGTGEEQIRKQMKSRCLG